MKKIYFLLAMLMLSVSSAWADVKTDFASIITPIGSESADIINTSRSKTMDDGVIMSFGLSAGNLFAQNASNPTWNNSAAVDELNSVLGKSLNASDYFPTNTGNYNGQGGRIITCTANLSNATGYDATKVVTFYVTLFSSGNGTPSITVSGFSSAYYSYAKADGNGFVDVSSLSEIPAGNYFTVVKVKGKLSAGSASVQYTMPNYKTGAQWMAVVYNEDIPSVENTYRYVLGEQEIANYTHEDIVGVAPTGAMSLPTYVTLETTDAPETCTGTASTFTYQVSYNETLPFQLGTPYSLTIRDDKTPQFSIYVDPADETAVKSIQSTAANYTTPVYENFNYFNWVVGGDFYNGFTFQNVATGKYLTYGENVSPADNTTSTIKNNRNCFKIKGTTNNTFINKRADDLSTWASSNADGETGSAITFCEPIEVYSTTVDLNLTDDAGNVFSATVSGKAGTAPHLTGAEGYTLSEEVWDGSTLTAKITFPFPTSSAEVKNPTCIQSALGESKWRANSSGYLKANNKANTNPGYSNQNNWNWYIYPSLSEDGIFSFQIYNVGAQKYIPTITTTNLNTETALSDEPGSYQFMQVRTDQAGFYQAASGKFLTINTSGTNQNIWLWSASGGHMGSTMSFPEAIRLANMRITNAGWATFWAPFAVEIPEGVKAYAGEMKEGWIRMNEITEGIIPENTGVVVAKEVEGDAFSADLKPSALQPDLIIPTCYSGNTTSEIMNVPAGAYLLQKNLNTETNEYVVGWYKVEGEGFTLAPNRCYLAQGSVPEPNQSRSFIGFEPVDDATGISSIATEAKTKADGKYMVKGQIVVVKAGKAYNMNGTEIK